MVSRRFRNRINISSDSPQAIAAHIASLDERDLDLYRKDLVLVAEQPDSWEHSIRLAAIARLDDLPTLTNLLAEGTDVTRVAADAIARLLHSARQALSGDLLESSPVRLAYIRAAREADSIRNMLAELEEDYLVEVACTASFPGVRRAAAERVSQESALVSMANEARNRDKSVFRIARTLLTRIRTARRTLTEADQRSEDIVRRLSELIELPRDRSFAARLKIIEQEWQECEAARTHALQNAPQLAQESPELGSAKEYASALERARIRTQDQPREPQPEPEAAPEAATEDTQTLPEAQPSRQPEAQALDDETLARIASWTQALPPTSISKPQHVDGYRAVWSQADQLERTRKRIARHQASLALLQDVPTQAPLLAQTSAWQAACREFQSAVEGLQSELIESFESQSAALKDEIEAGHLGNSNELRHGCGELLRLLPETRARRLRKRLNEMDKDMRKLRDWQVYAATPKRESLCERMAEIADNPLPSDEQLDRIRSLREEWKAMGPMIGGRDHELRRRFERLADAAFAPCRAHFQEQAEVRKQNLATRRQICTDLEFFIREKDWNKPDWKRVEHILHTARSEWRAAYPIDRSKAKPLQRRFDALCDDLFGRLSGHWRANETKARGLINELRSLLESTGSLENRIEGTRAIQARWRDVGPMSRSANRKLWKEFRKLGDDVHSEQRSHRHREHEAFKDRVNAAREILHKLEDSLQDATIESVSAGQLTQLAEQWEQFRDIQGETFKQMSRKWRDLARRYRQMLRDGDHARQMQLLESAACLDARLCETEQNILEGGPGMSATEFETLHDQTLGVFGKVIPERVVRLKQDGEDVRITDEQIQGSVALRRRMCVILDIDLERPSPPEDKSLRLEIQVQRINRGARDMGIAADGRQEPMDMARAWCQAGPVGKAAEHLSERFFTTLKETLD